MSVLVLGGSGTFGRAFVRTSLEVGADLIRIYSRGEHRQAEMRDHYGDDDRLRFLIGDVRDVDRLSRAMEGIDIVVHAAALKDIAACHYNPDEAVKTNVMGAMNVIEASTKAGVKKVLALSSDKAPAAKSVYGASKLLAEQLFLAANVSRGSAAPIYAVCRYGNIAGSQGSVIPKWREILTKSDTVPVTDPDCTRYWMKISEAVSLVMRTITHMEGGELAIPELPAYRLGDLAEAMNAKTKVIGLPDWEKKHESMDGITTSEQARRMTVGELRLALADL